MEAGLRAGDALPADGARMDSNDWEEGTLWRRARTTWAGWGGVTVRRGQRRRRCHPVRHGQKKVGTGEAAPDAVAAETPLAFIAGITAPVAIVGPNGTAAAEGAALQPVERVFSCESAAALGTARGLFRGHVAVRGKKVRRRVDPFRVASLAQLLPSLPRRLAEAEPMQTTLAAAVAV